MAPGWCVLVLVTLCGYGSRARAIMAPATMLALLDSREESPSVTSCEGDSEFLCSHGSACIPGGQRCDGNDDCGDGSDELRCPAGVASADSLKSECLPPSIWCGTCIPGSWRCDGEPDCSDGADEAECPTDSCPGGFHCPTGHCIHATWRCDGEDDCLDGSDERNCSAPAAGSVTVCPPGQFRCSDGADCVDTALVCDGQPQCGDGSDEGTGCARRDACSPTTCTAEQTCRPSPAGGHLCLCPPGTRPDTTSGCLPEGSCVGRECEHDCQPGGVCVCPPGFQLAADNRTCDLAADSAEPALVLADGDAVRQLEQQSRRFRTLVPAGEDHVLAVAIEHVTRTVYWSYRPRARSQATRLWRHQQQPAPREGQKEAGGRTARGARTRRQATYIRQPYSAGSGRLQP